MELGIIFRTEKDLDRFRQDYILPEYFPDEVKSIIRSRTWGRWTIYIPPKAKKSARERQSFPMILKSRV